MNHVDPEFLVRSKAVFITDAPLTLADVQRLAETDITLTGTKRRDLLSALARIPYLFRTPVETLPASPRRLRELFASKSAVQVNLSDKTFANLRSLALQALDRYGRPTLPVTKRVTIASNWRLLLDRIEKPYNRQPLHRLAAFCSVMGIAPADVTSETLVGLHAALEAEETIKDPKGIVRNTISKWNRAMRSVPGWPQHKLSAPSKKEPLALPLTAFPLSFQEDVATWRERMANPDPLDEEAPVRALRPTTLEHRVYTFRHFASALVRTGHTSLEEITSLRVLFEPERFKAGLSVLLARTGKTQRVHNLARSLRLIAKYHCRLDEATLATLERICKRLDPGTRRQMTTRNRRRLAQFDDRRNVARLLTFPEQEARWASAQANPMRAAKSMERAVAVALLIHCGLRIGSLRRLELSDFTWLASGACVLAVPAHRTKSGRPLEFELNAEVTALLKHHITEYRLQMPGAAGPCLFPGPDGRPRSKTALSDGIGKALRERAGLEMNLHLFRHAIAKIAVEADPGAYLAVSRVLGHTTLDTTMGHYLGTESKAAGRHVDRLLDEVKAKASKGTK